MKKVNEFFGSMVFNDSVMKNLLPKETYKDLKETISSGKPLSLSVANAVAGTMKEWAIERATHFTHWFQPMTELLLKNMIALSRLHQMARLSWSFQERSLFKVSLMLLLFHRADLERPSRRGYTAWTYFLCL